MLDTGKRVLYAGDIAATHPVYATAPHDYSAYHGARNRMWLARRHLPLPLAVLYVLSFALRTLPLLWRSRAQAARGGARLPRRAARSLRPAQAAACEDAVADDAGRAASHHLAASLSVP